MRHEGLGSEISGGLCIAVWGVKLVMVVMMMLMA